MYVNSLFSLFCCRLDLALNISVFWGICGKGVVPLFQTGCGEMGWFVPPFNVCLTTKTTTPQQQQQQNPTVEKTSCFYGVLLCTIQVCSRK